MDYKNLFIDNNLPDPLTKEELYNLFNKYKNGNLKAREEIITRNINLVLSRVWTKYIDNPFENIDLVSIGLIGLIKSVDTFDTSKNYDFSTYVVRCIDNEILMHFRKYNKTLNDISLNDPLTIKGESQKDLELKDTLEDKEHNIVSEYEDKELTIIIKKLFNELPENQKLIIGLYFGFFDKEPIIQRELATKLNISQGHTNKLIKRILKELKYKLETTKIIEITQQIRTKKL